MNEPKRAVVTAGASGIGLAIARAFCEAGYAVDVCDANEDAIAKAARVIPAAKMWCVDVSDASAVRTTFSRLASDGSAVDVLVNNAGIAGPRAAIEDTDEADWHRTLAVNVGGMFNCVKNLVPSMKARRRGCIVNISTATVRTGLPHRSAYVVSKHGVMGLTQNLARELGPFGIRCNAILPGAIDNERGRALVQQMAFERGVEVGAAEHELLRFVSMRSWIDPVEVAHMAAFLASDAARHVSGQFIGVCGNVEWEG